MGGGERDGAGKLHYYTSESLNATDFFEEFLESLGSGSGSGSGSFVVCLPGLLGSMMGYWEVVVKIYTWSRGIRIIDMVFYSFFVANS
jgi:hypothetical protein